MQNLPSDIQEFLESYPNGSDDRSLSDNLQFYSNRLRCRPDNLLVEQIHERWIGDYDKLEYKHGFIQWLFPIREYGMNYESQPLQPHELEALKSDPYAISRIIASYKLMLDFYGMRLVSLETGEVGRSLAPRNYMARYKNLVRSSHNNLRISRILKCLSEFGLERLNRGFLLHVLNEQSQSKELYSSGIRGSMDRWWANCLRNDADRAWIQATIAKVRAGNGFVFTKELYREALKRRLSNGHLGEAVSDEA
ncbi:MAG: opioid growth factor receptor conserved region-domain-containing protein [Lentinula lateritia]|uniref:Opioid growth factor receptor conserved region-domain-containing protein n=1 Tax=Lentinula lateritia TaxID=40482 RepID=A0ABQ8V494_9AGAR|nr:MAG: opioid growth factor receptor conserved region-domain-containing protein [Lentinula lateritia]KAJ4472399.1 opioid growth factor receptor conserved region-domain-containing protein [Lentinula lateritia]